MASFWHKLLHYFSLTTIVRFVIGTGYVIIFSIGLLISGLILTPILIWIPSFWWIALLFLVFYMALVIILTIVWIYFFGFATFGIGPNHVNARVRKRLLKGKSNAREDDPLLSIHDKDGNKILRFACVSDTHNKHHDIELPKADVFIIAGDFSYKGTDEEVTDFCNWLRDSVAPLYKAIIVIPGNHDLTMDTDFYERDWDKWHPDNKQDPEALQHKVRHALDEYNETASRKTDYFYLLDDTITYEGIVIHGAPWVLPLMNLQMAFTSKNQKELINHWRETIPKNIDLLITHGPPHGMRDRMMFRYYQNTGDLGLTQSDTLRPPKIHVFGHVHETYGVTFSHGVTFINCSTNTMTYQPVHPPIVFDMFCNTNDDEVPPLSSNDLNDTLSSSNPIDNRLVNVLDSVDDHQDDSVDDEEVLEEVPIEGSNDDVLDKTEDSPSTDQ